MRPTLGSLIRRGWLGGLAVAGVAAAHGIAYLVAVPDPTERAEVLRSTGHGGWAFVTALALGGLVAGASSLAGRGNLASRLRWPALAGALGTLQVAGFLGLEYLERTIVGAHPEHLFEEPAIAIGIAMQLLVAALGALLLIIAGRSISRIGGSARVLVSPRLPRASWGRPIACPVPTPSVGMGAGSVRGPPGAE